MREVEIGGVATPGFGRYMETSLASLAGGATREALADAGIGANEVNVVVFSNAAEGLLRGQEMIRGQVALRGTGLEGRPIFNTENACASGSSAAHLAWLMVASGQADIALAVGAEKLFHENKQRSFDAIESGTDLSRRMQGEVAGSVMMGAYAQEARQYADRHSEIDDVLAEIAVKNRAFATNTPHAQYRDPMTVDDVQNSRLVAPPLRLLTCSPLTDGAAAVVFVAGEVAATNGWPRVRVAATGVASYRPEGSVVRASSVAACQQAGIAATEVDVLQLHDACAFAELIQYEQVGLASRGEAPALVRSGATAAGGRVPTNTDGGLLSRGHALGATGLAQLAELTRQLQGRADGRQVSDATLAMAINAGGWMGEDYAACITTVLTMA